MTVKFDPEKPYGTIHGISSMHPGAKYQQGDHVFDVHRRCLNSDIPEVKETSVETATAELKKKRADEADEAMEALEAAKLRLDEEGTTGAKSAYTKARNVYEKAQSKLDSLSG